MKTLILLLALVLPGIGYCVDWGIDPSAIFQNNYGIGLDNLVTLKDGTKILVIPSNSTYYKPDTEQGGYYFWDGKQANYHWVLKLRTVEYPHGYWQWERKPLTVEEQILEELKLQSKELIRIRKLLQIIKTRSHPDSISYDL